jgi:KAP family P-loop domain
LIAIQERYKYLKDEFRGSDYLKKIIQLPIHITLWKPDDIFDYIKSLLTDYDDDELVTIFRGNVQLIVEALEPNPREVKRFLNLFILSYQIEKLRHQISKSPEHLLAIQAIRFRWEWFYDAILADSDLSEVHKPVSISYLTSISS